MLGAAQQTIADWLKDIPNTGTGNGNNPKAKGKGNGKAGTGKAKPKPEKCDHRKRATEKHGLKQIWAWVEDLPDDKAFMELVLSNRQGELSPYGDWAART